MLSRGASDMGKGSTGFSGVGLSLRMAQPTFLIMASLAAASFLKPNNAEFKEDIFGKT